MKQLLFFLSVLFFISCQKQNDPLQPSNVSYFTAKINGADWSADKIKSATIQGNVIVLAGLSNDKKQIILRSQNLGSKTYVLSNNSSTDVGVYTDSNFNANAFATNQWNDNANHGSFTVTALDTLNKRISGNFNMQVKQAATNSTRNITEGFFFNIPYTTSVTGVVATSDTFRAKVNGTTFAYDNLFSIVQSGFISISASKGLSETVGITVPSDAIAGSYLFSIFPYIGQYNPNSTTSLVADGAGLTILEHNTTTKRIRGNFSFVAKPPFGAAGGSATITEGYFSVKY